MTALADGLWLGGGAVAAGAAALAWARLRRRARLVALARDVTTRYARLLSVKQKQLVAHDGYGNYQLRPWIDHVDYFIGQVILREARAEGFDVAGVRPGTAAWARITRALLAVVNAEGEAAGRPVADADIISGEHYETLCRNLLRGAGWRVETTPATGDQGADLLAEASGVRIIIQCKFYGRPVGNKAVQEAAAAVAFHAGDRAAVVSNAGFTRAARQLASANAVLLLHHDQLPDLGRMVRRADAGAR